MGEVISGTADSSRVKEHIRTTYATAVGRGGEIAAAAVARLGPSVAVIDTAEATLEAAEKAEAAAWVPVEVADNAADLGIGSKRDAMWNALGRPRQSAALDDVFPGGVGTYTDGDLRQQPVLMQVLHARILAASAPQWTLEMRTAWAAEIEALRVPYAAAVEAHRPMEAAVTVAEAGHRAAVRSGQSRLAAFKRDLKNLGLTEAQIHEIIPDAGVGSKKKGGGGGGGAGGGGAGGEAEGGTPK